MAEAMVPEQHVEEGEEKAEQVASAEEPAKARVGDQGVEVEGQVVEKAAERKVKEFTIVSPTVVARELPIPAAEAELEDVPISSASAVQEQVVVPPVEVKVEDPLAVSDTANMLTTNVTEEFTTVSIAVEEPEQPAGSPVPMLVEALSSASEAVVAVEDVAGPTTVFEAAHRSDSEIVQVVPLEPQHSRSMPADDPHEWLLEHYASPIRSSCRSSPAPEEPPQTPDFSDVPSPPCESSEGVPKRVPSPTPQPPPEPKKCPKKKALSPSRSPTPTALLEQELDNIVADALPSSAASPRSDPDLDFGLELDLAAGATIDAGMHVDISIDNDLDDELLSLVDDKPHHHSHSHSHPHLHFHPHTHSQSHSHSHHVPAVKSSHPASSATTVQKQSPPKEPEPVETMPVVQSPLPVHAPSATPAPWQCVVIPPPVAPPQAVKQVTPQPPAKPDKSSGEVALPTGVKKEPTAKVRFWWNRYGSAAEYACNSPYPNLSSLQNPRLSHNQGQRSSRLRRRMGLQNLTVASLPTAMAPYRGARRLLHRLRLRQRLLRNALFPQ